MKKVIPYIISTILVTACLPQNSQIPQSPLLPLLEHKSGLIAYVGIDGNMYISDQAGGKLTQVTDDAKMDPNNVSEYKYYEIPAWTQDGDTLAFIGFGAGNGMLDTNISVYKVSEKQLANIFESESEVPVYLYWSPDNANLSFIATTKQQNNLILETIPGAGGDPTILDVGAPYYWSWAPDGTNLITHNGSDFSTSPDHISFIRSTDEITEYGMDFEPASFQAPAWSPDGKHIAVARIDDKNNEVIITNAAGDFEESIGTFREKAAFAWSFDSTRIAYIDDATYAQNGTVGILHTYNLETNEEIVVEDPAVATFFWAPNSKEIAYFTLLPISGNSGSDSNGVTSTPQYGLRLSILDVQNAQTRILAEYLPTEQFKSMLPFFDQYHQSSTIWSPDNNNIVISFIDSEGTPSIAIVPASGNLEPRILAPGFLAFWSWK